MRLHLFEARCFVHRLEFFFVGSVSEDLGEP